MPLLRYSIYSQGVNLYLAPTADPRDTWLSLMRTVASEGRTYVLSANQCVTRKNLPAWIRGKTSPEAGAPDGDTPIMNGGTTKHGRSPSITKTNEGHEICWPKDTKAGHGVPNGDAQARTSPLKQSTSSSAEDEDEFLSRGGSCIIGPLGEVLAGPLWEVENDGVLTVDVDFDHCKRAKMDFDVAGHYSRDDAFHLSVEGLDLNPPI